MASLSVHENAVGPCIVCGKDSANSLYWIGMSQFFWLKIRPYVSHIFQYSEWSKCKLEFKSFFIPPYDKPLCGTTCSEKYHANE